MSERGSRKIRVGEVVGTGMDKTAVVSVERRKQHPKFHKYIKRSKKYLIHDEQNELGLGDKVRIVETRPVSKRKNWRLLTVLDKSK